MSVIDGTPGWPRPARRCCGARPTRTSSSSGCGSPTCVGRLKSFAITRDELENALSQGMGFDGSSVTGFNAIEESDMIAMPDPDHASGCCPGAPASARWRA